MEQTVEYYIIKARKLGLKLTVGNRTGRTPEHKEVILNELLNNEQVIEILKEAIEKYETTHSWLLRI